MAQLPAADVAPDPCSAEHRASFAADELEAQPDCAIIEWMEPLELAAFCVLTTFFLVCGLIMGIVNAVDNVPPESPLWVVVTGPVVFLLFAVLVAMILVRPAYRRWKRSRRAGKIAGTFDAATQLTAQHSRDILAAAIRRAGLSATRELHSEPKLPIIKEQMARAGLGVPRIILDRRIAQQVLAIERTPHLLEPESIDSRGTRLLEYLSWLWLPGMIVLYWLLGEHSLLLLGFIAIGVVALALRIKHWIQTGVTPGETGLVAGVGYLEGPQGTRLSAGNVVTIICKARLQAMRVRLLAPDWNLELKFPSPRDPGFIAFWQRWNHPHPRPELVGEPAAT